MSPVARLLMLPILASPWVVPWIAPAHAQDVLLCRIDTGTATAELTVTAAPSVRNGSAVTALAAGLLAAHEDLRRVSLPLHASAPACAELLAGGFVDEGWTPPPVGGPRARPPVRRDDAADENQLAGAPWRHA